MSKARATALKVLIGTPIHEVKNYSMERWLKNVSEMNFPADLFMVDNSSNTSYIEKVKKYCQKYGLKNYQIKHIEFSQGMSIEEKDKRIEASQEIIRQEVLLKGYDAWFSWECDQIIPTDALSKLVKLMSIGGVMMVVHNSWERAAPAIYNPDMGVTLIARECLEKHGLLLKGGTNWQGSDRWFKERVFRAGGNYIDVYGVINPIHHLNK